MQYIINSESKIPSETRKRLRNFYKPEHIRLRKIFTAIIWGENSTRINYQAGLLIFIFNKKQGIKADGNKFLKRLFMQSL